MDPRYRRILQDADEFIKSVERFHKKPEPDPEPKKTQIPIKFGDFWPSLEEAFGKAVVAWIIQWYSEFKSLPQEADFRNFFPEDELPKTKDGWQTFFHDLSPYLQANGIPHYETPLEYLEPNFIFAVNQLVNPHDKQSFAAKLKAVGLTTLQWRGLLAKPKNREYFEKRLNEVWTQDTKNSAKLSIMRLVEAGDLQAIKHFHELENIFRPNQDVNVIMTTLLRMVMEILSKYVEPAILGKVAAEIKDRQIIEIEAR